ncbi:MAG: YggU family protein [Desulfobulbaceae bacterium]|nr:YggU family protein [Desulfobulbaceae bacterium]
MSYLSTAIDGTVLLRLHIQPKASKSRIVGLHDGCLKIAVAAPPVEGKANKAVVKLLADFLGVPARDVAVKSGVQSRRKVVAVKALDATKIRNMLEKML